MLSHLFNGLVQVSESHGHGESSILEEYFALMTDPAHILFEITISVLFDVIVVYLGYQLFFKRLIIPKLRRDIHRELDDEHHVEHHDHTPGDSLEKCRGEQ